MTAAIPIVPDFIPNQVLTNRQLNQLRDYLNDQDLETRAHLIGTGIVCGLFWSMDGAKITIDAGLGITSAGYLIEHCKPDTSKSPASVSPPASKITYASVRPYSDPKVDSYGAGNSQMQSAASYFSPFLKPGSKGTIWELIADGSGDHGNEITTDIQNASVLVLYLECAQTQLSSCLMTDCDAQGKNLTYTVKPLLIEGSFDSFSIANSFADKGVPAPTIDVPRLIPQNATSKVSLNAGYAALVTSSLVEKLAANIETLINRYADPLGLSAYVSQLPTSAIKNKLTTAFSAASMTQYQYDFFKDLNTAYNEAAAAVSEFLKCYPSSNFPRHLVLGSLPRSGWNDPCRQFFIPSPVRNVDHGLLQRAQALLERLLAMVFNVNFTSVLGKIYLTPSHTELYPLGQRAIPFYYDRDKPVYELNTVRGLWRVAPFDSKDAPWCFDCMSYDPASTGIATNPGLNLAVQYPFASLIRIEGHVGLAKSEVDKLAQSRDAANAEFDAFCSYLTDPDAPSATQKNLSSLFQEWGKAISAQLTPQLRPKFNLLLEQVILKPEEIQKVCTRFIGDDQKLTNEQALLLNDRARYKRELYCDVSPLQDDYSQMRSELMAVCNAILSHLAVLNDLSVVIRTRALQDAPSLTPSLQGPAFESLIATIVSCRRLDDLKELLNFIGEWLDELKAHPEKALQFLLWSTTQTARQDIQAFIDFYLPVQLQAMDYGVVLDAGKRVSSNLMRICLVAELMHSIFQDPTVPGARDSDIRPNIAFHSGRLIAKEDSVAAEVDVPDLLWSPTEFDRRHPIRNQLRRITQIVQGDLAAVALRYEKARASDPSLFHNLAMVDGLEHIGGVKKGGVFVAVLDSNTVVADFALSHLDVSYKRDQPVLPPVALPDFRIGRVRGDNSKDLVVEINLLDNIYDPSCDSLGKARRAAGKEVAVDSTLEITGLGKNSDLVGKVVFSKTGPKVVTYTLDKESARPGLIDRFTYTVTRAPLETEQPYAGDTGEVFILLLPIPEAARGSIDATVWDSGNRVQGAQVLIYGQNRVATWDETKKTYPFADLVPSQYTLVASLERPLGKRLSDPVTVLVKSGQATDVDLTLQALCTISAHVIDSFGAAVDHSRAVVLGITVALAYEGANLSSAVPDDTGTCVFRDLLPGTYTVQVMATKFSSLPQAVELKPGETRNCTLEVRSRTYTIPKDLAEKIAENKKITPADAEKLLGATYSGRYDHIYETVVTVGKDPHIVEVPSYKDAERYVIEVLTDPERTEEVFSSSYRSLMTSLSSDFAKASDQGKEAIRTLVTAVTLGTLDRISLTSTETLSKTTQGILKQAGLALQAVQVDRTKFAQDWDAGKLEADLGMSLAGAIAASVR